MDCALTQDYTLDCQDFYGGITTVYLIEKANTTVSLLSEGSIFITNKPGHYFRKYELEAHTSDGKETKVVNQANKTTNVKQQVMFPINGMSLSVRNEIEKLAKNKLLIVLIDNNGNALLYGKDFGMRLLNAVGASGKVLGDRNGYELIFESDEKYSAVFITSDVVAILQVPGIDNSNYYSYYYNGGNGIGTTWLDSFLFMHTGHDDFDLQTNLRVTDPTGFVNNITTGQHFQTLIDGEFSLEVRVPDGYSYSIDVDGVFDNMNWIERSNGNGTKSYIKTYSDAESLPQISLKAVLPFGNVGGLGWSFNNGQPENNMYRFLATDFLGNLCVGANILSNIGMSDMDLEGVMYLEGMYAAIIVYDESDILSIYEDGEDATSSWTYSVAPGSPYPSVPCYYKQMQISLPFKTIHFNFK